jgi:hypothetical protein
MKYAEHMYDRRLYLFIYLFVYLFINLWGIYFSSSDKNVRTNTFLCFIKNLLFIHKIIILCVLPNDSQLQRLYSVGDKNKWSIAEIILTAQNRTSRRKTCPSATLSMNTFVTQQHSLRVRTRLQQLDAHPVKSGRSIKAGLYWPPGMMIVDKSSKVNLMYEPNTAYIVHQHWTEQFTSKRRQLNPCVLVSVLFVII